MVLRANVVASAIDALTVRWSGPMGRSEF